jgi:hypothetical protein
VGVRTGGENIRKGIFVGENIRNTQIFPFHIFSPLVRTPIGSPNQNNPLATKN